uniref:G protein-coupled receptor 156 n=1 Tax=Labrus bergylta TaxID=56723 RepID=A0A3Q3FXF7_9LABR
MHIYFFFSLTNFSFIYIFVCFLTKFLTLMHHTATNTFHTFLTHYLNIKIIIIRDIQLMGMVALLILVDFLVLTAWNLADPVRCSRSVKITGFKTLDTCSSSYSDLWTVLIAVQKGCLLLYGTFLAGLTSTVSHPPVNQSPTIITAATLVTLSSAVAVPVSIFLQAYPNLVYSTVAGAIFICTLATNCMLFVPQLTQWRQFEEDQNNPSQMAKYFSSPSKSQPSVYSQDEIYYLLGENTSMKKLLSEKNAVIDSLQEQVNNAKGKLLRLMSASQPPDDQDLDSSDTNLNSSSTQTTELQSDRISSSSLPQRDTRSPLPPPPPLTAAVPLSDRTTPSAAKSPDLIPASFPLSEGENKRSVTTSGAPGGGPADLIQVEDSDLEEEEEGEEGDAEGNEAIRKCRKCDSRSHRFHTASSCVEAAGENGQNRRIRDSCGYWDSDSSSSTDYCYYHRPYCDSCLQRGSLLSSDSSSDSSDSEYDGYTGLYRSPHPVVFKEDLKPTFV